MNSLVVLTIALLNSAAHAHVNMLKPIPFALATPNAPLAYDGSNFPCGISPGGSYVSTTSNAMAVGKPQPLLFSGPSTHGGGSCQISVTTDKHPSKTSKWKVIKSFIGGCPAPEDRAGFNFTLPEVVPNGEVVLAWTWFNKDGEGNMYMSCAPVSVSGGVTDLEGLEALPDMFVANLESTGCRTTEGKDAIFPDPGSWVERRGKGPFESNLPGCGKPAGKRSSLSVAMKSIISSSLITEPVMVKIEQVGNPTTTSCSATSPSPSAKVNSLASGKATMSSNASKASTTSKPSVLSSVWTKPKPFASSTPPVKVNSVLVSKPVTTQTSTECSTSSGVKPETRKTTTIHITSTSVVTKLVPKPSSTSPTNHSSSSAPIFKGNVGTPASSSIPKVSLSSNTGNNLDTKAPTTTKSLSATASASSTMLPTSSLKLNNTSASTRPPSSVSFLRSVSFSQHVSTPAASVASVVPSSRLTDTLATSATPCSTLSSSSHNSSSPIRSLSASSSSPATKTKADTKAMSSDTASATASLYTSGVSRTNVDLNALFTMTALITAWGLVALF